MAAERIPLTLLTGFLGSGKTTLLQQLLRRPELSDSLVIVNELGAVGLDHQLLARAAEELPVVELPSGCMCCSLRTDLSRTLREVTWRFARQGQRLFQRVYVETTGMADPAPILRTLLTEPDLVARYRLDAVLVTVDAATAMQSLDRQEEAVKQVAAADLLLLTKADLVVPEALAALRARLSIINPAAPQQFVDHGQIDPERLRGISVDRDPRAWLGAEEAHDHAHHQDVQAHCLLVEEPLDPGAVEAWLDLLLRLHGPRVLRLKALLHLVGDPRPWVLHGVQHLVHPPRPLGGWPDADHRSRIVLITRGVPWEAVEGSFRAVVGPLGSSGPPL